ncbi:hypothetical protein [Clostridium tyrobutyricum]|uniref:hypothetical protein n=1 Tax=Clostridium tyrobutyricum TaxID=1519 RepID=UPI001C3C92E0|nr:hypothetical protein [Clostridium tyrobutyricum]MBV4436695.1 hypothetical protein [Clostridium tyrobutyricum]
MERADFYRKRIKEIEKRIQDAEMEKDFRSVAKLEMEKAGLEKRVRECEGKLCEYGGEKVEGEISTKIIK